MKIIVREEIANKLYKILKKAGSKEIKGACFAKFIENETYEIEEIYVSPIIGNSEFSNLIIDLKYKKFENQYFKKKLFDYENHNYIGDWHSHPLFDCRPSNYDIDELKEEVDKSNANFLIQLIIKIENNFLVGRCYYVSKSNKKYSECELELK